MVSIVELDWPAIRVDVERQMRFPWSGGRHPWLDAAIETPTHLIGIESKRHEPFRDCKSVSLSNAYNRDVWGAGMMPFCDMRDALRDGTARFAHLDAAQLLKHAYGLITEGRRLGKRPVLLYLFAEPARRGSKPIAAPIHDRHRTEIEAFGRAVDGAEVRFAACSYREWLSGWTRHIRDHADAVIAAFRP